MAVVYGVTEKKSQMRKNIYLGGEIRTNQWSTGAVISFLEIRNKGKSTHVFETSLNSA